MKELDIEEIIRLTENGKEDEAAQIISDFFNTYSDEDRGKAYVSLAAAYTKLMAQNNEELAKVLASQLEELKELDRQEKQLLEEVDLAQARNHLNS